MCALTVGAPAIFVFSEGNILAGRSVIDARVTTCAGRISAWESVSHCQRAVDLPRHRCRGDTVGAGEWVSEWVRERVR